MQEFLISVVAFIVLVGIMVIVHEFGHFATAKLCKVRVEAYSIGFGPRLWGFRYGETEYKLCLLPLGGYVKMTGENPGDEQAQDDPGAFTNHPRWQRMLIAFAGPLANFVLAFVAMGFYFAVFNEAPAFEVKDSVVEWVVPHSAAAEAGLQPGDRIVRFDTEINPSWEKVMARAALNARRPVPVTLERGGQSVQTTLLAPADLEESDFAGILPQFLSTPIKVHEVMGNTPAEKAGLRSGDEIVSVDGLAFHTISSLLAYMQAGKGRELKLGVVRDGQQIELTAHPLKLDSSWKLGFSTLPPPYHTSPLPLSKALAKSTTFCVDNSTLILEVLKRLFTKQVSVSQLSGPVGIARMAGDAAESKGWLPKFSLAGQISLNLGILNLLPFPILDGGMILFLLIESLIRRDIGLAIKERIYQAAFVVLIAFFAFVIFNDVTKLPIFMHLKP